jgi:hypothetical protein
MKKILHWLGWKLFVLSLVFLSLGCSSSPTVRRPIYRESQFNNRLEYLRFCMRYHMHTDRCE